MLKALAKRRDDRFPTMLELGRALEKAAPSPRDIDRALGTFVGGLLSERSAKREAAIREALRLRTGSDARPVNLGNKPIFDEVAAPPAEPPQAVASPRVSSPPAVAFRMPSPRPAPPIEAPASETPAIEAPAAPSTTARAERDADDIARLRPSRSRTALIGAGVALLVILGLVVWAVTSDSKDGDGAPVKHAF